MPASWNRAGSCSARRSRLSRPNTPLSAAPLTVSAWPTGWKRSSWSLRAWDLGAGDEVIVPSNTYIATWLAVTAVGARVVPVEPTPGGPNIDPDRIAAAITPRTRAIMPVHLYGEPADMDAIMALAHKHGLKVVEDVAQAQGAKVRGRRTGALGRRRRAQLLPDQEFRRLRRWRRGHHRRCPAGRAAARAAQLRQPREVREPGARLQFAARRNAGRLPARQAAADSMPGTSTAAGWPPVTMTSLRAFRASACRACRNGPSRCGISTSCVPGVARN